MCQIYAKRKGERQQVVPANCLWAERKNPLTNKANPRETQMSAAPAEVDDRLLDLVRFLARAAAEADFAEHLKTDSTARDEPNSLDKGHAP